MLPRRVARAPGFSPKGPGVTSPPFIHVACATTTCPASGTVRLVMLRPAALGVLELPTLLCLHCRAEVQRQEVDVPKTSHANTTNANAEPGQPGYFAAPEEGERSSPGNSSSASPARPQGSETSKSPSPESPAPTTENPSARGRTGSGSARGMGGVRAKSGPK